jgi:hypothetical protein
LLLQNVNSSSFYGQHDGKNAEPLKKTTFVKKNWR